MNFQIEVKVENPASNPSAIGWDCKAFPQMPANCGKLFLPLTFPTMLPSLGLEGLSTMVSEGHFMGVGNSNGREKVVWNLKATLQQMGVFHSLMK